MSLLPAGYDPRAEVQGFLDLVSIDAPSGMARFMLGVDGRFTDRSGNDWWGSQLISAQPLEWSRGATAPAGELVLSYFQDPAAGDLIDELRESGDSVLRGRAVVFWRQPIGSMAEFYAPRFDPVRLATRVCGGLRFEIEGDVTRRIVLTVEGPLAQRRAVRPRLYTVPDHNALIGDTDNPSLGLMPRDTLHEEKLFG